MKIESKKIAFIASELADAQDAAAKLQSRYHGVDAADADLIVALGGDGLMLQTLHSTIHKRVPIFGMNCGSVGFLMNRYDEEGLPERLAAANMTLLRPLRMQARTANGDMHEALAINEVSLLRQSAQAAKLEIEVDGRVRMDELICDGALLATAAGSTAYNLSAHGPILPIDAPLLALTPISAFRPRRWRGALLSNRARVVINVLEDEKRPVSVVADHSEFRNVVSVEIVQDHNIDLIMLFDHDRSLDERILTEQFMP